MSQDDAPDDRQAHARPLELIGAVKALEKEYMQEQLRRNPVAASMAIGIDEISLRKGHTYRIVVSDPERGKPIWFGGEDRSEASLDLFYNSLGPKKSKKIELAEMAVRNPEGETCKAKLKYDANRELLLRKREEMKLIRNKPEAK